MTYEEGVVQGAVEELARNVNQEPSNAALSFSGVTAEAQEGVEGYKLDRQATMKDVRGAISGLKAEVAGGPVNPDVTTNEATRLRLNRLVWGCLRERGAGFPVREHHGRIHTA
ncbi:MAG: peptidoglycan binding domain-containing protein [Rubrobacteraceae bacterium]